MHKDDKLLRMAGIDYLAGTFAGICQVLIGHPFDTVKVRLQAGQPLRESFSKNLYKGISSPLLGTSFCNAVVFTSYHNVGLANVSQNPWIAGGVAGAIASLAYCPMELYKIRSQLYMNHQFTFAYRGFFLTMLREIPSFSAYFGTYSFLEKNQVNPLAAGGLAGTCAWLACYPQDVVKTQFQSSSMSLKESFLYILRRKAFFKGLLPALMRSFPANAATFYVFNYIQRLLSPISM
jgi:solute carrier family 25 carnitine/acylcarnitine transporter 20/29